MAAYIEQDKTSLGGFALSYVARSRPLIALSGVILNQDLETNRVLPLQRNGLKLSGAESSSLVGTRAEQLIAAFHRASRQMAIPGVGSHRFEIGYCARDYVLPCRKASPQASPAAPGPDDVSPITPSSNTLHSPLSPLSPGSPLYPDGLVTPSWFQKHHQIVPSVYIPCFVLTSDPGNDSLNDNRLKNEIMAIKKSLDDTRYKSRFSVILLGDDSLRDDSEAAERVSHIKTSSRLDSKTGLFFLPFCSSENVCIAFALTVLQALQPLSTEYYRELTKHARRKRDRGPPPSATTSSGRIAPGLSRPGWIARYEYKLGLFADFRYEFDVAERHYRAVLDILLEPDGMFEKTDSWSRRWNETRTLADIVSIRLFRCLLLNDSPTSAVRSWKKYGNRMHDLVERKGKGASNYGFETWQTKRATAMAALISDSCILQSENEVMTEENKSQYKVSEKTKQSHEAKGSSTSSTMGVDSKNRDSYILGRVFAPVEVLLRTDQHVGPSELLHHPGYAYLAAASHAKARMKFSKEIPEDDRISPNHSPATRIARRSEAYETYLCEEPSMEYRLLEAHKGAQQDLVDCLQNSAGYFAHRNQSRMADFLSVQISKELIESGQYESALNILRPLWEHNKWRLTKWWPLVQDVTQALYYCAAAIGDANLQLSTKFELCSNVFHEISDFDYDIIALAEKLSDDPTSTDEFVLRLDSTNVECFVKVSVSFAANEGHIGEPVSVNIRLTSHACTTSTMLPLSGLEVAFTGPFRKLELRHRPRTSAGILELNEKVELIDLLRGNESDTGMVLQGEAELSLSPGQTRVIDATLTIKETGTVTVTDATVILKRANLDMRCAINLLKENSVPIKPWQGQTRVQKQDMSSIGGSINILPRPPKLTIDFLLIRQIYYTGEATRIEFRLENEESENALVQIEAQILSGPHEKPSLKWIDVESTISVDSVAQTAGIIGMNAGDMESGTSKTVALAAQFTPSPAELVLEIRASYTLTSDQSIKIMKSVSAEINVVAAFEASCGLRPGLHSEPWPSYFETDAETGESKDDEADESSPVLSIEPRGIFAKWIVDASLASMATEHLLIEEVDFVIQDVKGGATTTIESKQHDHDAFNLVPRQHKEYFFVLDTRKQDLDERRTTSIDATLKISWRRTEDPKADIMHTSLDIPQLALPNNEPRILAQVADSTDQEGVVLNFVLENPSTHFLTFNITMDSSEEFAFSGPKTMTTHLVPLSKHDVSYFLIPFVRGCYIRPRLKVVDAYFNKTLPIHATGNLESDEGGIKIWIEK